MIAPQNPPDETMYAFKCVNPDSIPAQYFTGLDDVVGVLLVLAILIPATLWTANEWRTWRVRRSLRQSVAEALRT